MTKIAIITPFNDIDKIEGGSRSSVKEIISYFDQFLILYASIQKNWQHANFEFTFIVLHSIPFKRKKNNILKKLDNLEVLLVNYEHHKTKIRPLAFEIKVECDYRLILDVDMYALSTPNFNFNADAQAMYGGNKYNDQQWGDICNYIEATKPKQRNLKLDIGGVLDWGGKEHYEYHLNNISGKIFPYFNNGAILIKNTYSKKLGDTWSSYKLKYINYIKEKEGENHQVSAGQNVIGIAIDNCVKNWEPFEPGFNFILQNTFEEGRNMIEKFDVNDVKLFHYINVPKGSIYEKIVLEKYKEIRKKYYSIWQILT